MNAPPVYYDFANAWTSYNQPGTVHSQNTILVQYFRRYLMQKAISVFKWKLPEGWARNYFLYVLYCWGFLAIINTDKFGVIPQQCGLRGYNVYYQPTNAIITNPLLRGIREPEIGTECVLLRLQPDYGGVMDLVNYYAEELALASEAISVNLLNSKLAYVFTAQNKSTAESFKKLYDEIASGNPAVVQDKNLLGDDGKPSWMPFAQNLAQTYIAGDLLTAMREIENQFCTDLGLPNANTNKKERLITDEVNANNVETYTRAAMWLEELQKGCEDASAMFGIDLSVDWRVDPTEGGAPNAQQNVDPGTV